MSLPWVRLQTSFPSSPEIVALIDARRHRAVVAYVCGLAYCGAHESGGFIPRGALAFIHATKGDAAALVDVGLWQSVPTLDGSDHVKGYVIAGWDKYQQTNVSQSDRHNAGKVAACKRWHSQPCPKCSPPDPEEADRARPNAFRIA